MIGPVVVTVVLPAAVGWMIARVRGAIIGACLGVLFLVFILLGDDEDDE